MKDSKKITISAISTALSIVLLVFGAFVPMFDLSCIFLSSIIIMLPLYKKTIKGALFSYFATILLSFIFTGGRFEIIITYAAFFGLHPIVNELQIIKKWNKWLLFILKAVWFIGSLFLIYYLTEMFTDLNEKFVKFINILIPIVGFIFFIIYDSCIFYFRRCLEKILKRIGI